MITVKYHLTFSSSVFEAQQSSYSPLNVGAFSVQPPSPDIKQRAHPVGWAKGTVPTLGLSRPLKESERVVFKLQYIGAGVSVISYQLAVVY